MCDLALSAIAEINPTVRIPTNLSGQDAVSFIPMGDVSESGHWTFKQSRPLKSVAAGFTAFNDGDILVAKITPCLENGKGAHAVGLENGIGFGSTEFHVLRARPGNAQRFVFQLTQWKKFRHVAEGQMVGSAGQQRVPRSFFDEFLVANFNLDEQSTIARILDTLDTTIRETEAIIAKLKSVKQGLLHDLLTRGLDENGERRPLQSEAPHLYKGSPLGWIPKEWEATTLDNVVNPDRPIVYGILMPGYGFPGRIPVVKVKNIVNGTISTDNLLLTSPQIDQEYHRSKLISGDLLFTIRGTVGRTAFVQQELNGANITQDTARLSISTIDPRIVQYYLTMPLPIQYINTHTIGVAVKGINLREVRKIPIPFIPKNEAAIIADTLDRTENKISTTEKQKDKYILLKSGLMDDLLTGRVRVTPLLEAAATTVDQTP